ncbi:hypothetical protein CKO51_20795 [Rhodopirellula sp. SM50]|nr:toll/interleukin-1 receptor domain-containing protein [Rhodopirellula sp. SM50]PAY17505.1 hypothetical protein CKO51_20795 [Rhodopirellula sp. SM50]
MTENVFVNYRRDDSGAEARLIASALSDSLSPESVFIDTRTISYGDDWPVRIRSALEGAQYVIVIIGPKWLHAGTDRWGRRRIDDESDWVRREIQFALSDRRKTVIPVLVNHAELPPPDVLPNEIADVTAKQGITIRNDCWEHDLRLLVDKIATVEGMDQAANSNKTLKPIWQYLDEDLRKVMTIAATLANLESKNYISTTNFVKALMVLSPGQISEFFGKLPDGALPEQVPETVPTQLAALKMFDSFSPCINSAMDHLTPVVGKKEQLSSEDVYIDIARYASGKSTQRLRTHGVGKADVENIVAQLGWKLVEREPERAG